MQAERLPACLKDFSESGADRLAQRRKLKTSADSFSKRRAADPGRRYSVAA